MRRGCITLDLVFMVLDDGNIHFAPSYSLKQENGVREQVLRKHDT